jgi:hypothetical protein
MCFGMGPEGLRVRCLDPLTPSCRVGCGACYQWEARDLSSESLQMGRREFARLGVSQRAVAVWDWDPFQVWSEWGGCNL